MTATSDTIVLVVGGGRAGLDIEAAVGLRAVRTGI